MIYTNFRELDMAGRIVISKDIRKHLDMQPGDVLHIEANDDSVIIKKAEKKCVFCNSPEDVREYCGKHVCKSCIDKLSEMK